MSKLTPQPVVHLDFLDCLRGIAIIAVFLFHCLGAAFMRYELPWGEWFREFSVSLPFHILFPLTYGGYGVAIFFVVSGFCIHLSFARSNPPRFFIFYLRRFFRIYPPYLIALIFFAMIFPITKLHFDSFFDWEQFSTHLLLIHNYESIFAINPSFWSIAVEAQLYLIYPALLLLVKKLGWTYSLFIIGILEFGMRVYLGISFAVPKVIFPPPTWITSSPFSYWFSWSIGAKVADDFLHNRKLYLAKSSLGLWLLLCLILNFIKPLASMSFTFASITTATYIAKLLQGEKIVPTVPSYIVKHVRLAGIWSYSIYLLHQPFLATIPLIVRKLSPNVNVHPDFLFAACLLSWFIILPISMCFYYSCELSAIKFGKTVIKKLSRN